MTSSWFFLSTLNYDARSTTRHISQSIDLLNPYLLHRAFLLEKITSFRLAKKLPAFYRTRRFIPAFTSALHLSLFWDWSIQSISPHRPSERSIIIQSVPLATETRHFLNNSNTNEDIATQFEQEYVRCVRNEKECVCSICYDVITFLTQGGKSASNFVAISSLVVKL